MHTVEIISSGQLRSRQLIVLAELEQQNISLKCSHFDVNCDHLFFNRAYFLYYCRMNRFGSLLRICKTGAHSLPALDYTPEELLTWSWLYCILNWSTIGKMIKQFSFLIYQFYCGSFHTKSHNIQYHRLKNNQHI